MKTLCNTIPMPNLYKHMKMQLQPPKNKWESRCIGPEYDVMVEYTSAEGQFPTHGIHLWLGKENEKSMFMYIGDDEVYLTTPKMTEKLRTLILSGE